MDNTIKPEDISSILSDFDRKKKSDEYTNTGKVARTVASAISTDTPITVLTDIRQLLSEISNRLVSASETNEKLLQTTIEIHKRNVEDNERRHTQTLAYMSKLTELLSKPTTSAAVSSSVLHSPLSDPIRDKYYYKGDEIKTSDSMIACIMIHLDNMVSRIITDNGDISDTSVMELKDWSTAVRILKSLESRVTSNTEPLSLPKMASTESIYVLNIVASTVQGRSTICKTEHIHSIVKDCPAICRCVEEIRQRALACPGIITSSKLRHISALSYPYIDTQGNFNITNTKPTTIGSVALYEKIKKLNIPQRKEYAKLVLSESVRPMVASVRVASENKS